MKSTMKHLYPIVLTVFMALPGLAAPVITAKTNNGKWATTGNWDLNRLPQQNDTIIIPANMFFRIENNNNIDNVIIRVFGTLSFSNGKLNLDNVSRVIVELDGRIEGNGNNDFIKIGNVFKFRGSDPPVFGYSYADNTTGSGFNYSFGILPINFSSFYATFSNDEVSLAWSIEKETAETIFEIEKKMEGSGWNKISVLNPRMYPNAQSSFNFVDRNINAAKIYYRIRMINPDGSFIYSTIKMVTKNKIVEEVKVYKSALNTLTVLFPQALNSEIFMRIMNTEGRTIKHSNLPLGILKTRIHLENAVPGIYYVHFTDGQGNYGSRKIVL